MNSAYHDNIVVSIRSLNISSSTDRQESSSPSEGEQELLSVNQERDNLPLEEDEIDVSPHPTEDTAQAQQVEDMEDAPTHLLVEVRGCEVPSELILLLLLLLLLPSIL